ncbi:MAG: hypothetical protein NVSMB12_08210 [Acidimicrobiales bacterium]
MHQVANELADAAADARRCRWCQRPLTARDGPGRPREYCRQSCRQRDYEARRRADERGLDEGEIIVTRSRLDRLQDRLWVLSCAIADVEGDLARSAELDDYRSAVSWLLDAAKPVVSELDA